MSISFWGLVLLVIYVSYNAVAVDAMASDGEYGGAARATVQTALDVTVMVLGEKYIWVGAELFGLFLSITAPSLAQRRALNILDPGLHAPWRALSVLFSGLIWGLFQYIR